MSGFFGLSGRGAAVLVAVAGAVLPALAHPTMAELEGQFARGEYLSAAAGAEGAGGADNLAFAARALLAQCMTGSGEPDAALVDRAVRDAEAVIAIDPGHVEGRLQLAIALSLKSRTMDLLTAWNAGYGERGRKLAEGVLRTDAGNFYAHGFLAVWHVEVQRRGGGMGAWMMGASMPDARRHYDAARGLAPDDVGIHWQFARALAALDADAHEAEIMGALARAVGARAGDHVERVMQARARQLIAAIDVGVAQAQALARALL